jgi:uncharacterized lipoprotein YajG
MPNRVIGPMIASLATSAMLAMVSQTASAQAPANRTQVPPAVLQAFQQSYPGATISATAQDRDRDRTVFRVESVDKGRRRTVLYDGSGTVVEVAEQVDEKDLPRPVFEAMHAHPRAIYVSGLKVTRGGNVDYRLTVRGTRKTAMIAKPDGTVVSFK